jgi:SAM-dependent methyltransferase
LRKTRSNVTGLVLEDMTRCSLPSNSFDGVVCVEVIEHVHRDDLFISQIDRVLKPGGWLYLTTPNGDYIKNEPPDYNPDHWRHYTRAGLRQLLETAFPRVRVVYGVKTGKWRHRGLRSISPRNPFRAVVTMTANLVSHVQSRGLDGQPRRTAHLFATAWRNGGAVPEGIAAVGHDTVRPDSAHQSP